MTVTRTAFAFEPSHPTALAIYCSDGRFTRAVEALLASLGHDRLDTLTMPGGPALLNLHGALYSDADATVRAADFLIRGHGITHAILLAHDGCGYYRARYPNDATEPRRARQLADLAAVRRLLEARHPRLEVDAFYAHVEGGVVKFAPVEPPASAAA